MKMFVKPDLIQSVSCQSGVVILILIYAITVFINICISVYFMYNHFNFRNYHYYFL